MTYGVGHSEESGLTINVFVIEDNRFHTGQRDWHANAQIAFGDSHATLDVLHKSGSSDAGRVSVGGVGPSTTTGPGGLHAWLTIPIRISRRRAPGAWRWE
jgi:hypothetical protein